MKQQSQVWKYNKVAESVLLSRAHKPTQQQKFDCTFDLYTVVLFGQVA